MMLPLKGLLFIFLWPKGVSANVIHTENVRGQVLYLEVIGRILSFACLSIRLSVWKCEYYTTPSKRTWTDLRVKPTLAQTTTSFKDVVVCASVDRFWTCSHDRIVAYVASEFNGGCSGSKHFYGCASPVGRELFWLQSRS